MTQEITESKTSSLLVINNTAKSILNKATGFIGKYDFTLNPYRGCQYGCSYCYATAFSPNQQMRQNWGKWVIIKENAAELLRKELEKLKTKQLTSPSIYMSSVTDPYQPIETKTLLTRSILEVLLDYQPILVLQTRSPVIVRDADLLRQFKTLRINMSIPTFSEAVRRDFEPRSPSIISRLQAMSKLKFLLPYDQDHEIKFSITVTPLLPSYERDINHCLTKLHDFDRIVIQPFHATKQTSLTASTPKAAIQLKEKYAWWYNREKDNYLQFKEQLTGLTLSGVEIKEGEEGFRYD
ncbi:MAG: radical SAM protein [Merismopediaceae bacterium]|nr:radical SAM protein [Merismopediaceae bacterium]